MAKRAMGRPAIFAGRERDNASLKAQATLTRAGKAALERRRRELATLTGWPPTKVSTSDTIEFALRGRTETRRYLVTRKLESL